MVDPAIPNTLVDSGVTVYSHGSRALQHGKFDH